MLLVEQLSLVLVNANEYTDGRYWVVQENILQFRFNDFLLNKDIAVMI
jgi:hypothetical protein